MRILATICDPARLGIVLDLNSGEIEAIPSRPEFLDQGIVGRPSHRPFGIAWSPDEVFIINNRKILVFDKHLRFQRILAARLQINTHQLAYRGNRVWAVSPWTNSLIAVCPREDIDAVEFDLINQHLISYISREACESDDKCHYNSLLWAHESLFVAAHAFGGKSFINRYDATTLQLTNTITDVGSSIHGLACRHGELFWVSTKTGEIRSGLGYRRSLTRPGYPRGFAMTDQHFIVATSEFLARGDRDAGNSWIQVIDRQQGTVIGEHQLLDTGSINDLRLLDEYDYAHCVPPLWHGR